MIVKKHVHQGKALLAICDDDVFDKKFSDEKRQLDLTADFFKGEKLSEEDTKKLIKHATYLNLNGKKSVSLGIKLKYVNPENIIEVEKIPHAECVVITE